MSKTLPKTSGLELYADPSGSYPFTSYTDLSNNIAALPAPIAIPYNVMNNPSNANYHLGGSLVKIWTFISARGPEPPRPPLRMTTWPSPIPPARRSI